MNSHWQVQMANEDSDQIEDTPEHNQEEWMLLCQLQPTYATPSSQEVDNVTTKPIVTACMPKTDGDTINF